MPDKPNEGTDMEQRVLGGRAHHDLPGCHEFRRYHGNSPHLLDTQLHHRLPGQILVHGEWVTGIC